MSSMVSNQEFLIKKIPNYHPSTEKYTAFWREEKRKCIEGVWVSGKWMPGKLYYYVNYGTIKLNKDKSKVKTYGRPLLRDLEWELFLLWTEARGFSGFILDDYYTCLNIVKDWRELEVEEVSEELAESYPHAINPHTGKLKEYVEPREYLRKIHTHNLGKPLYENQAKNMCMMGARGYGKSFSLGGIVSHEYLFDGTTEYIRNHNNASEVVVGAGDAKYSTDTLDKVRTMIERLPGAQEIGNQFYPAPFFKRYTGTWEPGKEIKAAYKKKVGNTIKTVGSKSSIKHRTFKDNPFAANGTRPGVMLFEEIGMFNNLLESYAASVECQRDGSVKFGSMMFIGTGGDISGGGTLGAQSIFYEPEKFDCLSFNDDWENKGRIGYFIPAYKGLADYKDSEGNTREEDAKLFLTKVREKLRLGKSTVSLESEIVNRPLVPSEMFLQRKGSIFPVPELQRRLSELEGDNSWALVETPVELFFDPKSVYNGVDYRVDIERKFTPINNWPWSGEKEGCIVIYEMPQLIDGKVPKGAYIIGHDPYGSDSTEGESLGAIIVMKNKKYFTQIGHDEIVAVYYARPYQGRGIVNENLLKLSKFYGDATIYFENVRGNVKEYFEKVKRLDLLAHKTLTVLNKRASYNQTPSLEYGYPISSRDMKLEAAQYVRDWLLEERAQTNEGEVIRNLDRIWDRFLLKQLIAFNLDGNFDSVMALMGCVIGLNETYNQYEQSLRYASGHRSFIDSEVVSILTNNKKLFK